MYDIHFVEREILRRSRPAWCIVLVFAGNGRRTQGRRMPCYYHRRDDTRAYLQVAKPLRSPIGTQSQTPLFLLTNN